MLQIRLSKPSSEGGGGAKPSSADSVTVACPDHLVLADLPVAKILGSANAAAPVKIVGRRSRRQLGERVHFCVRCDFPIAIYGRLSPCDHVFCLDCARSDSLCYLCDERIQKIQTIKLMEGIFICAAPHCLKSFIKKTDFESHIHEIHTDLLLPNTGKDGNDSDAANARKPTTSESTVQAPPRSLFSPGSNPTHDYRLPSRDQQPPRPVMQSQTTPPSVGQLHNNPSEQQVDSTAPPGFDRFGPQNRFPQQNFDSQSGLQQPGQVPDRQQGILSEPPSTEYPMHPPQPSNFAVPINKKSVLVPAQFGYPPLAPEGTQPFYGTPYEITRPDSTPEARSQQGSLLGFPPGASGGMNFTESYIQPWNMAHTASPASQGMVEGLTNASDPQGRAAFLQGDHGRNTGLSNQGIERGQGGLFLDPRDGKGILAPQPSSLPPPPALASPQLSQHKRSNYYSGDTRHD